MATDGRSDAIIESSTLVNFLKIDRADLLGNHPAYRFIVVDAVRNEITKHYAAQVATLDAAFAAGKLFEDQPAAATSIAELAAFAAMAAIKKSVSASGQLSPRRRPVVSRSPWTTNGHGNEPGVGSRGWIR